MFIITALGDGWTRLGPADWQLELVSAGEEGPEVITGYRCVAEGPMTGGPIIFNEYDKAKEFCENYDACCGFEDVGCDNIGPFVICDNSYGAVKLFNPVHATICLTVKEETEELKDFIDSVSKAQESEEYSDFMF
jgi:hypothetical protein